MAPPFRILGYLALAALAACAEVAPRSAVRAPAFELDGRVAVRSAERVYTGQVRWQQDGDVDDIRLLAPLGQTVAVLRGDAGGAVLTTAERREYRASSIESLTRAALGWPLPVAGLRFWVLGQAVPDQPVAGEERDAAGRIIVLVQEPWRIAFAYPEGAATRPSRLDLHRSDAEIRFAIDALKLVEVRP